MLASAVAHPGPRIEGHPLWAAWDLMHTPAGCRTLLSCCFRARIFLVILVAHLDCIAPRLCRLARDSPAVLRRRCSQVTSPQGAWPHLYRCPASHSLYPSRPHRNELYATHAHCFCRLRLCTLPVTTPPRPSYYDVLAVRNAPTHQKPAKRRPPGSSHHTGLGLHRRYMLA